MKFILDISCLSLFLREFAIYGEDFPGTACYNERRKEDGIWIL